MPDSEKLDTTDEHADDQARDEETPDAGDGEAGESSEGGDPEKDGESTKTAEKGREEREKKGGKGKPSEADDADGGKGAKGAKGGKAKKRKKEGHKNPHAQKKSGNPAKGTRRSIAEREASKSEKSEKEPVKFKSPHSPKWWVPLMVSLMVIGLIIVVLAYVFNGQFPMKGLGNGNLFIGFAFMLAGFLMTMGWK